MNSILNRSKLNIIIWIIATLIIGIMLTFLPVFTINFITLLIGWILLIGGIAWVIMYFVTKPATNMGLFFALLIASLGFGMVLRPQHIINFLSIIFGLALVTHGFLNIQESITLKDSYYSYWYIYLIMGIISAVLGIFVIWSPIVSTTVMTVISGISLIIDSFSDIALLIFTNKLLK